MVALLLRPGPVSLLDKYPYRRVGLYLISYYNITFIPLEVFVREACSFLPGVLLFGLCIPLGEYIFRKSRLVLTKVPRISFRYNFRSSLTRLR